MFSDELHGWIATGGPEGPGAIYRTVDGGKTWDEVDRRGFDAYGHRFFSVYFLDPLNGWACGEYGDGEDGVLWITRDGGESWEVWEAGVPSTGLPLSHPFFQVCFPGPRLGFLISGGLSLLASRDRGRHWSVMDIPGAHPYGMTFLPGGKTGFIVSQHLDPLTWQPLQTTHFRSDDGGETWTKIGGRFEDTDLGVDVAACRFWDERRGLLCGPEGVLYSTSDGAASWQKVGHAFVEEDLNVLGVLPDGRAYVAGSRGLLAVSEDHGRSWSRLPLPSYAEVHGFCFFEDGRGFVVGEEELAMATSDGGRTWEPLRLP